MKKYSKEALTPQKVLSFLKRGYHVFFKKDGKEYELIQTLDNKKLFYCYDPKRCMEVESFDFILDNFEQWESIGIINSYKFYFYE